MKTFLALRAAAVGAIVATHAAAQGGQRPAPGATLAVHGVAYDSISRQPLRNAFVSMLGSIHNARSTTTDSHGRFRFDSVPPGDYTFAVQHAALDSLGLSGVSRHATVATDGGEIEVSVPSFATLWRIECGTPQVPKDSGFVFGTIRDAASMRPLAKAQVEVTWTELGARRGRVTQRVWHSRGVADDDGNYAICGLPTWEALFIRGQGPSATSGDVELSPGHDRVQRRDLIAGPNDSTASRVGIVSGTVADMHGVPMAEARVALADLREVRTDADGHFTFRGVPLGTQQIEAKSVGVAPVTETIDVLPRDTATITLRFGQPIVLEGVRVTEKPGVRVTAHEFDVRRRVGTGYVLDSTVIEKYPDFVNVFNDVPGLRMARGRNGVAFTAKNNKGLACVPTILLDGLEVLGHNLSDLLPREVAAVEVYAHPLSVPAELLPPGRSFDCGLIVVWTKYAFRNR